MKKKPHVHAYFCRHMCPSSCPTAPVAIRPALSATTDKARSIASETLKTPGHIANPVSLIFRYIRVGFTRFNNNPEFNT